jgi:signal transduction histidine kinase
MMRFRTLRGRLTALELLAATAAITLLTIAFNFALARSTDSDANARLRSQAAAAATTITVTGGRLHVRESPDDAAVDRQVWVYEGRRALLRAAAPQQIQRAADALAGRSDVYKEVGDDDVRLYAAAVTDHGRHVGTVVAGLSLAAYNRTTGVALIGSLALASILLLAVFGVTWVVIGRALAPVTEMTRSAADWSEHDLERRFGPTPRPDELGALARTFDGLLDRVAASLRHEQRLSAELSHELRTPLARIVAEMELLQRRERSSDDRREAYAVVQRSADAMSSILEMLMAAARADAQAERGRSDLEPVLDRITSAWAPTLAARGVRLEVRRPAERLTAGADAEVVERIVAPLLDNAARYARTRILISAAPREGRVHLVVRDDGPGVPAPGVDEVFEPGVRANGTDGHAGAGLGLSLARRLARAAGGDVVLAAPGGDGAGAQFLVDLPA